MISERLIAALEGDTSALDEQIEVPLRASREGVALGWLDRESFIRIDGTERAAFLHRLLTAELASLSVDRGRRALLLDTRGRVAADLDVWGGEESWVAMVDRGVRDETIGTLQRFVLRADVALAPEEDVALVLAGPRAGALLERVGAALPASRYEATRFEIAGSPVTIRTTARVPWGVVLHFEGSPGASIDALEAAAPELCLLGPTAQEVLRIESGVPRAGRELTGDEFPQEARLEEAVSFEKGCYLGQETVARIHYRGHVNRLLCRLEIDGEADAPVALELDGRAVGSITSAAAVTRAALGYVRREHAEPGNRLGIAGQERAVATVRELSAG